MRRIHLILGFIQPKISCPLCHPLGVKGLYKCLRFVDRRFNRKGVYIFFFSMTFSMQERWESKALFVKYFWISLCYLCVVGLANGQTNTYCHSALEITKTVEKYHVDSKPLDDSLSAKIFAALFKQLDSDAAYFTQTEFDQLEKFKYQLDDQILNQQCDFVQHLSKILFGKFEAYHEAITNMKGSDFNFDHVDTLYINQGHRIEIADQINQWKKKLKLQVLTSTIEDSTASTFSNFEFQKKADEIIALEICQIGKKVEDVSIFDNYIADQFLKAVTLSYDPHTSFLTASDKEEFEAGLSKVTSSFGITVGQNDQGETQIMEVLPGSSAWRSGELDNGDIITGVEDDAGSLLELNCLWEGEISKYLNKNDLLEATFYIKKIDGSNAKVLLKKEETLVSENIIESFILEGDRRIAFIELPSFYVGETEQYSLPNGCANDVAKELVRLQKENIDGLILDLRYNGGGAILEAIRMAGMFVNYGAIGIEDYKDEAPSTLKDMDRGTVYDGPLLILVGGMSASASELFSAAMQDHNRALIVGGQTFGKSTIQAFVPINAHDDVVMESAIIDDMQFMNLTIGRFYRVTGHTMQNVGVSPDIEVPGIVDMFDIGEASYSNTLDIPKVDKKTYYWPLDELPVQQLQVKSKGRTSTDTLYQLQLQFFKDLNNMSSMDRLPIGLEYLLSIYEGPIDEELELPSIFDLQFPKYRQDLPSVQLALQRKLETTREEMNNDFQVREAFRIINDLITIQSK